VVVPPYVGEGVGESVSWIPIGAATGGSGNGVGTGVSRASTEPAGCVSPEDDE
jgi:hypothetical protein